MKLSKLLATRHSLLRQAQLATLGHAYLTLQRLAARVANANLRGLVRLQPSAPQVERYWPTLTAREGNQSVIEEQFSDSDIMDLADAAELAINANYEELEFRIEEFADKLVTPLRRALENAGVAVDIAQWEHDHATGKPE
ncbi:MAG: hypothetical protein RIQ93_689 [Verrucomicrobiota bacterium]|jgi:hypothetical protein